MADKYLNYTVLSYYNGRIAAIYATKSEIPTKVSDLTNDSNFATTSEVNTAVKISTIKVNSSALTPDANKAVDISVPTTVASLSDAATYANKIEVVKKNGTALTINNKAVDISVPTSVSDLSDASSYANKIEVVKRNGVALSISSKSVDVSVPTTVAELSDASDYALASSVPSKTSDLTNDSNFITASDVPVKTVKRNGSALTPDANGAVDVTVPTTVASLSDASTYANKIETIKVNNTEQTITSKSVNITVPTAVSQLSDASNYALASSVPTKVSDLTNDSGYQTASDVSTAISTAVSSVYRYKGSVATYADLPSSGLTVGDVYDVVADGTNYAWTGTVWDALGGTVDVSLYWAKSELTAITTAEIDALFT